MQKTFLTTLAAVAAFTSTVTAGITIEDIGIPANGGTPTAPTCTSGCAIYVTDVNGCSVREDFSGTCAWQEGYLERDVCDGFKLYWDVAAGSVGLEKPNNIIAFPVQECKVAEPVGQCVFNGGCPVGS
ncbi:hypothetical protein PMZ80_004663 [Knufia obscura]|uniref:Uncharacterized protein n=1 Tax=Knufia obscura TaxID=1635080 RepID=A0ABR0RTQ6_9EURO|nr:hypothetical protein PMZ80_004663 [Knufia obscura]